jgi:FlaA1/EpsC-like NDP-sugar epimerase
MPAVEFASKLLAQRLHLLDLERRDDQIAPALASAGRRDDEIAIAFTGLRPGEKLHEELLAVADEALPTPAPRVLRVRLATAPLDLDALTASLQAPSTPCPGDVRAWLAAVVPEYRPGPRTEVA